MHAVPRKRLWPYTTHCKQFIDEDYRITALRQRVPSQMQWPQKYPKVSKVSRSLTGPLRGDDGFIVDPGKLLFSVNTFIAAAAVLVISFTASLPRPWWALLTVYVTAQPMAGAFRPKVLYRLGGIAAGAIVAIALVPNLQNSPVLLVLCLALWTGFCIYLAVFDRTPRAFLYQMAAFSAAVISFPYLYDPSDIFTTTISRVEEMTLAILCVTAVHRVLQPRNVRPAIRQRARSFLADASRWTTQALGSRHTALEYEQRRKLAADVTELGVIAGNLRLDRRYARATQATVTELQHQLAALIPIASAAANRLDLLRMLHAVDHETTLLVDSLIGVLRGSQDAAQAKDQALASHSRALAAKHLQHAEWTSLLAASLCDRMAEFVDTLHAARERVLAIDETEAGPARDLRGAEGTREFPLARDHGLALLAGAATASAIMLYCALWILLAWPAGAATAAFAALITCSFSAQDDPAPAIGGYLLATLSTFPLAALYLLVILPRVDGAGMLILTLAPALVWMGYLQADPARAVHALPMLSCFIVAMGFLDRFQPDFAAFLNTGFAQVGGIVTTLAVTRLFRSVNVRWTAHRMVQRNWADLEQLADPGRAFDAPAWTAHAVDRLGQIAARMAMAGSGDSLHAADGLIDLRIGRNIIQLRAGLENAQERTRRSIHAVLGEVSALYRARLKNGEALAATPSLLSALDEAINTALVKSAGLGDRALLALVGMRCNFFPNAQPFKVTPA